MEKSKKEQFRVASIIFFQHADNKVSKGEICQRKRKEKLKN